MSAVALRFAPVFRQYIWGGRRLASVLGKPIGDGPRYAESWEVVDHGEDQSVVNEGPLAGWTLSQLVAERGEWLLGGRHATNRFPLLMKYLDCNRNLSIQVHPDDRRAAQLDPPDLGKTEAWYIIDSQPGAQIYAGLKAGVTRAEFESAIAAGAVVSTLNQFHPSAGDCVFIPAGVIHALGEGLLVAEIQQASDTTFRLDDWGRVDDEGNPRELHIEAGVEAIDFDFGPVSPQPSHSKDDGAEPLVACDKFVLTRRRLTAAKPASIGGDGRCHIVAVVEGEARVEAEGAHPEAPLGQTLLIPAASDPVVFTAAQATLLDAHLP